MLFDTAPFFIFLTVFLLLYHSTKVRGQNLLLVVGSYVFYGWWDWRFCFLLGVSTLLHYVAGLRLSGPRGRFWLIAAVAGQLGLLGFFKYYGFFVASVGAGLERLGFSANLPSLQILLPVGISFYTFQVLSYTLDIWRKRLEPTRNFVDFAAFVAFWPHLVAGPILRASAMLPQIQNSRQVTRSDWAEGTYFVLVGLVKKVAVADIIAPAITPVATNPGGFTSWELALAALLFSLRIYCDFSGYTDVARGVSLYMGFRLPDNFRWPYLAVGIRDFWHRWHMSLGNWLRDYLYFSLGGSRSGTWKTYRNLMVTMVLGGLWHGASWSFVAWGALHGVYLVIAHAIAPSWIRLEARAAQFHLRRLLVACAALGTFVLVTLTWIPFLITDFSQALTFFKGLAQFTYAPDGDRLRLLVYGTLVLATLDLPEFLHGRHHWLAERGSGWRGLLYGYCVALLTVTWTSNHEPFIYFQF